ncbi:MAG: MFS transporter [Prolixibacteraceae bacterium]|jgi:fucose permease|nr:MFS transporter [Prolixibacteraceae bacterium]
MKQTIEIRHLVPVLFGFFIMGFIDLVGISSNYIKQDFQLTDTMANFLLMMVFFWFAVLSVPTGVLMNRIGRKNTVLLSVIFTAIALSVPFFSYNLVTILIALSLLGISNTILQVSVNPLLADIVPENRMASSLTFGQFIKAIASFLGPVITGFMAWYFGNWRLVFPALALISVGSALWLYFTPIAEEKVIESKTTIKSCLSLLKDPFILSLFLGIVLVVGIDVGLNTSIPKYLMDKAHIPLEQAGLGISLYFISKTIGTFLGSILLMRFPVSKFYRYTSILAVAAIIATLFASGTTTILTGVFITGLAVANVFSIIFSIALIRKPDLKNEISGLMMMGIIGGAIIPLFMGIVSDRFGQQAALLVLLACLCYLLVNSLLIKIKES